MNERTKADCKFLNTAVCELLNAKDCESCPMFSLNNEEETNDAYADMRTLCEFLPETGVEPLFYEEKCALCKSEKKGKPVGFAQLNMGHLNPLISVSGGSGSNQEAKSRKIRETRLVIPAQLPVCASCRRKLLLKYNLPLIINVLSAALGLIITSVESVRTALTAAGRAGAFIVFLTIVLLGTGIALLLKDRLDSDIKENTKTKLTEIKQLGKMLKNGWFTLPMYSEKADFTFTKNRLKNGILTGDNQKALINAVLEGNRKIEIPKNEESAPEYDSWENM